MVLQTIHLSSKKTKVILVYNCLWSLIPQSQPSRKYSQTRSFSCCFLVDRPEKMQFWLKALWLKDCLSLCVCLFHDSLFDLCEALLSVVPLISGELALCLCSCWLSAGSRTGQDSAGRQTRGENDWLEGWGWDELYGSISDDLKCPLATDNLHVGYPEATLRNVQSVIYDYCMKPVLKEQNKNMYFRGEGPGPCTFGHF